MTDVLLHEEHGEVVRTWRELGYRGEHVVCFDRHLDLKPLSTRNARLCRAAGDTVDALNRPLPLREADGAYGLDDFWSVGPVSGAVSGLTWIPSFVPRGRPGRERLLSTVAYIPAPPSVLDRTRFDGDRLVTHLCGLDVDICSFETLANPPDDFRIDLDLDWFAEAGAPDEIDPRLFGQELSERGWAGRVDSATFSVRSGFLTDSQRRIGTELLAALGRAGSREPAAERATGPAATLAALQSNTVLAPDRLRAVCEQELADLGGLGLALEGLLRLGGTPSPEDIVIAEQAWLDATAAGVSSTWLAYRIGLHHFRRRRFEQARLWLDRTLGSLVDPLEGHAWTMAVLCSTRLQEFDDAAVRAHGLSDAFPLNARAAELALAVDDRAGRPRDEELVRRLDRVRELVA
ncbi:MAG: hypothetical protein JWO79_2645 [Actinomycetia bacterium]|nr:hypothetical protein [Actinomycetes bacterium]